MKKMILIAGALMLIAGSAMAAGTNVAWNDCLAGGGVADRTVNCTNTGSGALHLSFDPPTSLGAVVASAGYVDVVTTNPINAGTSWWQPTAFASRWGQIIATGVSGVCPEWWAGAPTGANVFTPSVDSRPSANRMRIHVDAIVDLTEGQPVDPGTEYFAGGLVLKFNAGTLGNAECLAGGAIGTYDLNLQQQGMDTHLGQTPIVSNCATFRGGGGQVCPGATPTKKTTWGSIKAIYR